MSVSVAHVGVSRVPSRGPSRELISKPRPIPPGPANNGETRDAECISVALESSGPRLIPALGHIESELAATRHLAAQAGRWDVVVRLIDALDGRLATGPGDAEATARAIETSPAAPPHLTAAIEPGREDE